MVSATSHQPQAITVHNGRSSRPVFVLHGSSSDYVFGIGATGQPVHFHWGLPLGKAKPNTGRLDIPAAVLSPRHACEDGSFVGLDRLPLECPTANTGAFGEPVVDVRHADGTRGLRLVFQAYEIHRDRPPLPGLPGVSPGPDEPCATLLIRLRDDREGPLGGVELTLSYTVFPERNLLTRSLSIRNAGNQPVFLESALSMAVGFSHANFEMLQLTGAWAREFHPARHRLHPGLQATGTRRGASGPQSPPFFALGSPGFTEESGTLFGFALVYSGNHLGGVEVDPFGRATALMGIHPAGFCWKLEPGGEFHTPEVMLASSLTGLGGLSQEFHAGIRDLIVPARWRGRPRPVTVNNWEATYFDFDSEKLIALADAAAALGIDLLVLDDGWFGRRDNDRSSLGDWFVHRAKLPEGLDGVAREITSRGLGFGLWFEPEMVSPDSELYRRHPDWCLHVPGRDRTLTRHQLVLDFSRDEVVDAIAGQMLEILRTVPVSYIKWDMNRHLTEVGSAGWPADQQGEVFHRHILGVYRLACTLLEAFPDLLIEGCSSGGGRFDPGMLAYCPQVWTSDNSDAIARLRIQHGASILFPPDTMICHISESPNHQVHRNTPFTTRARVAMAGVFGFQLDLLRLDEADRQEARKAVRMAKAMQSLVLQGHLLRLADPFADPLAAWMLVAYDGSQAVVTAVLQLATANMGERFLRLRGLDGAASYRIEGPVECTSSGAELMGLGLSLNVLDRDFSSARWVITRLPAAGSQA